MSRLLRNLLALATIAMPALTLAGEPAKNDPQAQGWYLAPSFSFVDADSKRGTGTGKGGAFAIGHHGEVASIEVAGLFSALQNDGAEIAGGQVALIVAPMIDHAILSRVFGVFAIGAVSEKNIPGRNGKDGSGLIGDVGLGYLQPMPVGGRKVNLRFDARYRGDFLMPPRDAGEPSYFRDWVFNLGVLIPLSPPPPPPPQRPLPEVVPPVNDNASPSGENQ